MSISPPCRILESTTDKPIALLISSTVQGAGFEVERSFLNSLLYCTLSLSHLHSYCRRCIIINPHIDCQEHALKADLPARDHAPLNVVNNGVVYLRDGGSGGIRDSGHAGNRDVGGLVSVSSDSRR